MIHPPAPHRACPACDSTVATRIDAYSPNGWVVAACDACGFVFLRNPPPYAALEEDFAWEKTYAAKKETGGSTGLSTTSRRVRTGIRRLGAPPGARGIATLARIFGTGRVLDIGCGHGHRILPPMVPYGIELSRALHAQADARMRAAGGFCLHAAGAEGIAEFDAEFFDGIVMHSYLEHETAVARVLEGSFRALKPGGKVYVRVPNFASLNRRIVGPKWCGFRYPDHVNYFTPASLARVAARAGFTTHVLNRFHLWFDDNIKAVLRKPAEARGRPTPQTA